MVWNLFETIWDYGDLLIYVNTKLNKWLGQYRFIARDFVDNFKVYGEITAKFRFISLEWNKVTSSLLKSP